MTLGDRLRDLRIGRRESLFQVADAVGSSKAHIWDLERNRSGNPSLALLRRLAAHYETTVADLVENGGGDSSQVEQFVRRNGENVGLLGRDDLRLVERLIVRLAKAQALIVDGGPPDAAD